MCWCQFGESSTHGFVLCLSGTLSVEQHPLLNNFLSSFSLSLSLSLSVCVCVCVLGLCFHIGLDPVHIVSSSQSSSLVRKKRVRS